MGCGYTAFLVSAGATATQRTFQERISLSLEPDLHNVQRCDWKKAKSFSASVQNTVRCTNTKETLRKGQMLCVTCRHKTCISDNNQVPNSVLQIL